MISTVARVAITGASGTIGAVLMGGLAGHTLKALDLPECDVRTADLARAFKRHDAVVHLAWNTRGDNAYAKSFDSGNSSMTHRVFEAALAARVPRVVMASSVHADRFETWSGPGTLSPDEVPWPDSPYGAGKVLMESLGRYYAAHRGLEVICVRFGGVNAADAAVDDPLERAVWLRHEDCVALIEQCITIRDVPGRFAVLYGVSETDARPLVSLENSLGWRPRPRVA
jgi:uronate dehydrogenase